MLDEEKYILIERFFSNELSEAERSTFERLLATDTEFGDEVKLQRLIVGGIKAHGKDELKKELAAIYLAAKPEIEKQHYRPKARANLVGRILRWIFGAGAIGAIVYLALQYKDKLPVNMLLPKSEVEQKQNVSPGMSPQTRPGASVRSVHRDTIWHFVHMSGGKRIDTLDVHGNQEAVETLKHFSNHFTIVSKETKETYSGAKKSSGRDSSAAK